ncbi:hypothetical protein HU200_052557 [Digitaria exilis]|uniref:Uncharacterized protein n=1 Tax=Digitaria exilis TaxID=1010633 RepID=A0A835E8L8_9POAL|nr:hypothetical protein HU200_052557 [Digitaria exilis]
MPAQGHKLPGQVTPWWVSARPSPDGPRRLHLVELRPSAEGLSSLAQASRGLSTNSVGGSELAYNSTPSLRSSRALAGGRQGLSSPAGHVTWRMRDKDATTKRMVLPSSELREYVPPALWFLLDIDGMIFEELMATETIAPIYFVLPVEMQHHHLTRDMVVALTIKPTRRPPRATYVSEARWTPPRKERE